MMPTIFVVVILFSMFVWYYRHYYTNHSDEGIKLIKLLEELLMNVKDINCYYNGFNTMILCKYKHLEIIPYKSKQWKFIISEVSLDLSDVNNIFNSKDKDVIYKLINKIDEKIKENNKNIKFKQKVSKFNDFIECYNNKNVE